MLRFLVLLLTISSFSLYAANPVSGTISVISSVPSSSSSAAAGFTEFQLAGVPLDAPCGWLHIRPDDQSILSILLAAHAQQKIITVYYDTNLAAPWAAGSCGITTVQMQN